MGEVHALPNIRMVVSAFHGYVDFGGQRYGFLASLEHNDLRVWRVENRTAVAGDIPEPVLRWVKGRVSEMVDALQQRVGGS